MNKNIKIQPQWKVKFIREMTLYFILTVFLTLLLSSLSLYKLIVLGDQYFSYFHYGYNFFESLILAKIIMLGQYFKLGDRFLDKPLIIPTLYKSFIISIFIIAFGLLEHFIKGLIFGKTFTEMLNTLTMDRINEILGRVPIFFTVFVLFFGFLEVNRVLGDDKLFHLFFRKRTP